MTGALITVRNSTRKINESRNFNHVEIILTSRKINERQISKALQNNKLKQKIKKFTMSMFVWMYDKSWSLDYWRISVQYCVEDVNSTIRTVGDAINQYCWGFSGNHKHFEYYLCSSDDISLRTEHPRQTTALHRYSPGSIYLLAEKTVKFFLCTHIPKIS